MNNLKKMLKKFAEIPLVVWAGLLILGNLGIAFANSIPATLIFNGVMFTTFLIGLLAKYIK